MNFFEEWITVFRWEGACPKVVVSSAERGAHRKTDLRRLTQLRGANADRRRMHCGRSYSGEADVVGGDDFFEILSSGREHPNQRKNLPGTPIKQVAEIP
jgi:hypothetical protein